MRSLTGETREKRQMKLYNTLTARKEELVPIEPGKLGVYVCGPTVYSLSHVGHARCYIAYDVIVRYLRRRFDVTYARNYTDIDDKIIVRANETGEAASVVSEENIVGFKEDMAALGNLEPDIEPKVTEHIAEIVAMIEVLIDKGFAYASEGDVYYAVRKFGEYGKLSKRSIDELETGARVAPGEVKRDALDFALWKGAKDGEPSWESPWGPGRPGWHIECSAMGCKHLGDTFDIHGGGVDLVFPHHENEIAQSEAATGQTFANYWLHNGHVKLDDTKMSKSLGNFFTIRELLAQYEREVLRWFLLSVQYRSPINYTDVLIDQSAERVRYVHETLAALDDALAAAGDSVAADAQRKAELIDAFEQAMDDDFNTAKVLADLSDVFKNINQAVAREQDDATVAQLRAAREAIDEIGATLGLFEGDPREVLARLDAKSQQTSGVDPDAVEALLAERVAARSNKDFARADGIRDELAAMGVTIKDSPEGTTWTVGA